MSTPQTVICRLCSESKRLDELSLGVDRHITNVCLICRQRELQAVLAQVAAILEPEIMIDQSSIDPNSVITTEMNLDELQKALTVLSCGHPTTCWCSNCHYCEDI